MRQECPPHLFPDVLYLEVMYEAKRVPSSGQDSCARFHKALTHRPEFTGKKLFLSSLL
jgi:hypothetical protein